MPAPGRTDDVIEAFVARFPSEFISNPAGIGDKYRRVAGTSSFCPGRNRMAGDLPRGLDDLADRITAAVAQIIGRIASAIEQGLQRQQVRPGEVGDMDIVAQAGTVRRGVILAEYPDRFPLARGHLEHQGNQVGFGPVAFSDVAVGVGARGVEVAQDAAGQVRGGADIRKQAFHCEFGGAIRVGG